MTPRCGARTLAGTFCQRPALYRPQFAVWERCSWHMPVFLIGSAVRRAPWRRWPA